MRVHCPSYGSQARSAQRILSIPSCRVCSMAPLAPSTHVYVSHVHLGFKFPRIKPRAQADLIQQSVYATTCALCPKEIGAPRVYCITQYNFTSELAVQAEHQNKNSSLLAHTLTCMPPLQAAGLWFSARVSPPFLSRISSLMLIMVPGNHTCKLRLLSIDQTSQTAFS
jgi:hypothetical protein